MRILLASDYDGTIKRNKIVNQSDVEKITKFRDNGNLFGIATGRSIDMILPEVKKYNIPYDFLVCNNGGVILSDKLEVLYRKDIEINAVKGIVEYLSTLDLRMYGVSNGNNFEMLFETDEYTPPDASLENDNPKEDNLIEKGVINSILTCGHSKSENEKIFDDIMSKYSDEVECYINNSTVDINAKDVSKKNAIDFICNYYGLDQCYVIGDGHNDIEMIGAFNGFAVDNAIDVVKEKAQYVVDSVKSCIEMIEEGS